MPDGEIANVGNSPTGYLNKKCTFLVSKWSVVHYGQVDDIYMRLGKVILWYAEAANENGNTQAALVALNKIRERAREGDTANTNEILIINTKHGKITVVDQIAEIYKNRWQIESMFYGK